MCVGVTLQCGYGGVVSVCRLKHFSATYLVRCVLVLRCHEAMVVWYPYAGLSTSVQRICFDVCWCYVAMRLWWCGIRMQAEALKCTEVLQPAYGYHTTIATV